MLLVFFYVYWCPTLFPNQIMLVAFNSNRKGITNGAGTAYPSTAPTFVSVFSLTLSLVRVDHYSCFCVVLCRPLFVILSVFRLANVLYIIPLIMASNYLFGFFKLFSLSLSLDKNCEKYNEPPLYSADKNIIILNSWKHLC